MYAASTILTATRINTAISPALLIRTVNIKVTTSLATMKLATATTALVATTTIITVTTIVITMVSPLLTTIAITLFVTVTMTMTMIAVGPTLVKCQSDSITIKDCRSENSKTNAAII